MNPLHLAQHLVNQFGHVPGGVTPLKLQKLLYYVKAWSLVNGDDLVAGNFVKWKHGPVHPSVYNHFRDQGYRREPIQPVTLGPGQEPTGAALDFVDFVGHSYARFPAVALSKMTHEEDPWLKTEMKRVIPADLITTYYSDQPFADNIPFDPDRPYVPVQGHMDRALTFDMNAADALRATTYDSYHEYLDRLERAGYRGADDWLSGLLA